MIRGKWKVGFLALRNIEPGEKLCCLGRFATERLDYLYILFIEACFRGLQLQGSIIGQGDNQVIYIEIPDCPSMTCWISCYGSYEDTIYYLKGRGLLANSFQVKLTPELVPSKIIKLTLLNFFFFLGGGGGGGGKACITFHFSCHVSMNLWIKRNLGDRSTWGLSTL